MVQLLLGAPFVNSNLGQLADTLYLRALVLRSTSDTCLSKPNSQAFRVEQGPSESWEKHPSRSDLFRLSSYLQPRGLCFLFYGHMLYRGSVTHMSCNDILRYVVVAVVYVQRTVVNTE